MYISLYIQGGFVEDVYQGNGLHFEQKNQIVCV
jgi:hypothetical protein